MRAARLAVLLFLTSFVFAQSLELPVEVPLAGIEYADISPHDRPRLASSGDEYLAVWTDRRQTGRDFVYASRLKSDGTPVDVFGIRVAEGYAVDVVWTGRRYLIFADTPDGRAILSLDKQGALVERHSLDAYSMPSVHDAAMATNGANVLLVASSGIAVRLDLDGRPYAWTSISTGINRATLSVGSNGEDYLVAFARGNNFYTQRVPSAGMPETQHLIATTGVTESAIASDGDGYLVVWSHGELHAQSVDRLGRPNAPKRVIASGAQGGYVQSPRITRRGNAYVVTHTLFFDAYETHVDTTGEVITPPRRFAFGLGPDVEASGSAYAIVWSDQLGAVRAGVTQRADRFETTTHVLTRGAPAQTPPRLARAGDSIVAVWKEQRELRIARVGGEVQRVAEILSAGYSSFDVRVASHGEYVWVVWRDGSYVYVHRYTRRLERVDEEPLRLATPTAFFGEWDVAAGEESVMLVMHLQSPYSAEVFPHDIVGTIVRVNGAALEATHVGISSTNTFLDDIHPAVAWNGSEYVVAWVHLHEEPWWQFSEPVPQDIRAMRIRSDGVPLVRSRS